MLELMGAIVKQLILTVTGIITVFFAFMVERVVITPFSAGGRFGRYAFNPVVNAFVKHPRVP